MEIIDNTVTYLPNLKKGKLLYVEFEAIVSDKHGNALKKYNVNKEYYVF